MSIYGRETFKHLTKAQRDAIDLIGRRRKSDVRIGKDISAVTANRLIAMRLVMTIGKEQKSLMLTYNGERIWTALHPNSKYRIK